MRNFTKKVHMGVLLSLLLAALIVPKGAAAAEYSCTASIPVQVQVYAETDAEFTVQLEAEEGVPLPEDCSLTITGSGTGTFGPMEYTVPGDYVYTLHQTKGNAEYVTYDDRVYIVTVRVTNDDKGGLVAELWAVRAGETKKVDKVLFSNRYNEPAPPVATVPPTGDTANLTPLIVVFVVAAVALVVVLVVAQKRKKK